MAKPESGDTENRAPPTPNQGPEHRCSVHHPDLSRMKGLEQFRSKIQEPRCHEGKDRAGISWKADISNWRTKASPISTWTSCLHPILHVWSIADLHLVLPISVRAFIKSSSKWSPFPKFWRCLSLISGPPQAIKCQHLRSQGEPAAHPGSSSLCSWECFFSLSHVVRPLIPGLLKVSIKACSLCALGQWQCLQPVLLHQDSQVKIQNWHRSHKNKMTVSNLPCWIE